MPLDTGSFDTAFTVCPHDCPSCCALEVERIDGVRIGRVRGAGGQSYTDGVVCAKVARYAERQYHPERLTVPLRRVGGKGVGRDAFVPSGWDDALDLVAEGLTRAAQRHGSEAVWPYYYSGTMGLVQRDLLAEAHVAAEVDGAHAAGSELLHDLVAMCDDGPEERVILCHPTTDDSMSRSRRSRSCGTPWPA